MTVVERAQLGTSWDDLEQLNRRIDAIAGTLDRRRAEQRAADKEVRANIGVSENCVPGAPFRRGPVKEPESGR